MIGIDGNTGLLYEGKSNYGHGVWPNPIISIATLISQEGDWEKVPSSSDFSIAKMLFREDIFDPVTRVRRGRLYTWKDGVLQQDWHVAPHPVEPPDHYNADFRGRLKRTLYTFHAVTRLNSSSRGPRLQLILGTQSAQTIWEILSIETIASGEALVTLRARSNFGILPELLEDQIPSNAKDEVFASLDNVANAAFRSSPASLIDVCRAALTVIFSQWLSTKYESLKETTIFHRDVGDLLRIYKEQHKKNSEITALEGAVRLLQRFHSRGKPNEQKRYDTRPLSEEDAQLALHALGFILREIGWAR